ncbi:MAG: MFS transporter [Patescibacteria group bacterium]|nr:MFS transporter [Patescibacteria group bacterium]MDE1945953.1 MFS transporter [Patescibacteria group bacterium]
MERKRVFGIEQDVFLLGLTSFFNDFSSEMILSVMPAFFISVLRSGAESLGIVEGIAEAASDFMKIYSGKLADRIGRKKIFAVIGYSLSVATRPFYLLVQNVGGVIGLRITDRLGKGLRDSPRDALIRASVPAGEMGKSFGYHRTMDTIGAIAGPLVAYLVLLRNPHAFNTVFVTAFVIGIAAVASLAVVSDVKMIAATRAADAKIGYRMPRGFKRYLAALFILSVGSLPTAVLLFKTADLGLMIASIPLFYMIYNVSYAVFSLPAGSLGDRVGKRKVIFAGYAFLIVGYLVLTVSHTVMVLVAGFLLAGMQAALTDGTQRAYAAELVDAEHAASSYGYLNAVIGIGSLVSGILGGYLWQHAGDNETLVIAALVIAAGLAAFAVIKPRTA